MKRFVGYLRYDTKAEMDILNDLYRTDLRLFKNFFQPAMKLILKERIKGHVKRKYDIPKTPYARLMESLEIPASTKQELKKIYASLNPAELKRNIDKKLQLLYKTYKTQRVPQKNQSIEEKGVEINKKIKTRLVRKYIAERELVSV